MQSTASPWSDLQLLPVASSLTAGTLSLFLLFRLLVLLPKLRQQKTVQPGLHAPLIQPVHDQHFLHHLESRSRGYCAYSSSALLLSLLACTASILSLGPHWYSLRGSSETALGQAGVLALSVTWILSLLSLLVEWLLGNALPGPILSWWWSAAAAINAVWLWYQFPKQGETFAWSSWLAAGGLLSSLLLSVIGCCLGPYTARKSGNRGEEDIPAPRDAASLLSKLTFLYVLPLLRTGYKRPLQVSDVPKLPEGDDPEPHSRQFTFEWQRELASGSPSLLRALSKVYGGWVALQAFPCFLAEIGSLAGPLLLQHVLDFLTASPNGPSSSPTAQSPGVPSRAVLYAGAFFLCSMLRSLGTHNMWMNLMRAAMQAKYALVGTLCSKALVLAPEAKTKHSRGKVQNMVASDVDAITVSVLPYIQWWTISQIMSTVVPGYFLYQLVGPSYLVGISVLLVALPLSVWVAGIIKRVTKEMYEARDARVKLINEVVRSIQVVKCLAWDDLFLHRIANKRQQELDRKLHMIFWDVSNVLMWDAIPAAIPLVTFTWYCLYMQRRLSVATAFTAIAWLDMLQYSLNSFPWIYRSLLSAWVSYTRIQDFLLSPEVEPLPLLPADSAVAVKLENCSLGWAVDPSAPHKSRRARAKPTPASRETHPSPETLSSSYPEASSHMGAVVFEGGIVGSVGAPAESWGEEKTPQGGGATEAAIKTNFVPVLQGVTISIPRGKLTAVVGPVGSGKSTLLAAICGGDAMRSGGEIAVLTKGPLERVIPMVGQEPWVQNMSIKENVLFGHAYNAERYEAVILACSLVADIQAMPQGHDTVVGERGSALSGGQRARLALARACYQYPEAELFVFDDCLRGLDAHVSAAVLSNCLLGYLAGTTRVVATHETAVAMAADHIILLEHGQARYVTQEEYLETVQQQEDDWEEEDCNEEDEGDKGEEEGPDGDMEWEEEEEEEQEEETVVVEAKPTPELRRKLEPDLEAAGGHSKPSSSSSPSQSRALKEQLWGSKSELTEPLLKDKSKDRPTAKKPPIPGRKAPSKKRVVQEVSGQEAKREGAVSMSVFLEYFKAAGGVRMWLPATIVFGVRVALGFGKSVWLAVWTGAGEDSSKGHSQLYYIQIYAAVVGLIAIMSTVRNILLDLGGFFAARTLHRGMLCSVLRAPMAFFTRTPSGQILNRFSTDTGQMDSEVPEQLSYFIGVVLQLGGAILVVVVSTPAFLGLLLLIGIGFLLLGQLYRYAARDLRRLQSLRNSPIYSHFAEAMEGAPVIRAFDAVDQFVTESKTRVRAYVGAMFSAWSANQFVTLWMDAMGAAVVLGASFLAILETERGNLRPELAALSITYSVEFAELLMWSVRNFTELEVAMVAVERVHDYAHKLPSENWGGFGPDEDLVQSRNQVELPEPWPSEGHLEFRGVSVVYPPHRHPKRTSHPKHEPKDSLPSTSPKPLDISEQAGPSTQDSRPRITCPRPALSNVTFEVFPGERVGVVGRSGAGKSSLVFALFRLVELQQGAILIDNVDTQTVPLRRLRQSLTMVPQEPVIFSGSLRLNLDPRGTHPDSALWEALESVQLKGVVGGSPLGLESELGGAGVTLSLGQKQLLCVARALLVAAKVAVLDEASSAVDKESERAIQRALLWRPGMRRMMSRSGSFQGLVRRLSGGGLSRGGSSSALGEGSPRVSTPIGLGGGEEEREFYNGTVIYIAHKLASVLTCDKVIVMEQGRVVEMDTPSALLGREGSQFLAMCEKAGETPW